MKAVLISIHPKWCELIASGKKTIEVRKTRPKLDVPFKCYIYCTRFEKGKLIWKKGNKFLGYKLTEVSGKVIGEFVCNAIVGVKCDNAGQAAFNRRQNTCLTDDEIMKYANHGKIYYWHISNLKIYDNPKELNEFQQCHKCQHTCLKTEQNKDLCQYQRLTRPPQSWCYVEESGAE